MLWAHEAQPGKSTTNFDHCDDAYRFDKSTDSAKSHSICFLPQYQRQRSVLFLHSEVERELKMALRDILTCAALSVLLWSTAN